MDPTGSGSGIILSNHFWIKKKSDNVEKIIVYSAKLALRQRDKIYIWLQIFSINYSNVFFTKKIHSIH